MQDATHTFKLLETSPHLNNLIIREPLRPPRVRLGGRGFMSGKLPRTDRTAAPVRARAPWARCITAAPTPAKLHAQSVVFEDGDFVVLVSPRRLAAHQLADLPDAVPGHGAAGESFGEPYRLVVFDLIARADHDRRGAAEASSSRSRRGSTLSLLTMELTRGFPASSQRPSNTGSLELVATTTISEPATALPRPVHFGDHQAVERFRPCWAGERFRGWLRVGL